MLQSSFVKLATVLMINVILVNGISTIEVSPDLTQTTWATNYVGPLFTFMIAPSTTSVNFQWSVTQLVALIDVVFLTPTECAASSTITSISGRFSATCSGTATTLTALQPITNTLTILLVVTSTANNAINGFLNMQVVPTDCQLQQTLGTLVSVSSTPCTYNCTAIFQCIAGYSTIAGSFYTTRCNSFATLESDSVCALQQTTTTTGDTTLPVWAIVLISLGGLALLAIFIFLLWKYCNKPKQITNTSSNPTSNAPTGNSPTVLELGTGT